MQWLSANAYVPADDRGLNYGDGLFETMRVIDRCIPFLDRHMSRLAVGLSRLGFDNFDYAVVARRLVRAAQGIAAPDAWLKLTVTRGSGHRGYAPPQATEARVFMRVGRFESGVSRLTLQWCETRLPTDPLLAGIKHLNRLPQVMAARELSNADEGLMSNLRDEVVCGIMNNVFIVTKQQLLTPPVSDSGVAGVMRGWVLDNAPRAREAVLSRNDVLGADEVIVSNALHGIRSAFVIAGKALPDATPVADQLRHDLAQEWLR